MKVLIQGLGEVPTTIELALKKEKPDVTYILCSDYQLKHIARDGGYSKPNVEVVEKTAKNTHTKVVFQKCNVFDPESVNKAIQQILGQVDPSKDEVVVNYTGGSALVRLFLGVLGVGLSRFTRTRILYAISYPKGIKITTNQTEKLKELLPTDLDLLLGFLKKTHP